MTKVYWWCVKVLLCKRENGVVVGPALKKTGVKARARSNVKKDGQTSDPPRPSSRYKTLNNEKTKKKKGKERKSFINNKKR